MPAKKWVIVSTVAYPQSRDFKRLGGLYDNHQTNICHTGGNNMARNVPVSLKDPYIPVYNADRWLELSKLAGVNQEFTAVEIKSFYVIGLIVEICASVDCLLKANSLSETSHPLAVQIFNAGGQYLPAFGVLASGVELLGRCLTGNEKAQTNENLNAGFYYLVKPSC